MESSRYIFKKLDLDPTKVEQKEAVPVIDIIRHGETDYKYGKMYEYSGRKLDTKTPEFALTEEYLDLNREGILTIRESVQILLGRIDKENEVVLIISSPSARAHSSALIIESELRKSGVNILNDKGILKFSEAIDELGAKLYRRRSKYMGESEGKPVDLWPSLNKGTLEKETLLFHRFLRHMNNIYNYLRPETLKKIKDKKLRIVCVTHAEVTREFIRKSFNVSKSKAHPNGQILEIKPESKLKEGLQVPTVVEVLPTNKHPKREAKTLERTFDPKA